MSGDQVKAPKSKSSKSRRSSKKLEKPLLADDDDSKNTEVSGNTQAGGFKKKLVILLVLILGVGWWMWHRSGDTSSIAQATQNQNQPPTNIKAKSKDKKSKSDDDDDNDGDDEEDLKLLNVELIESEHGNLGWRPTQGPLVTKRTPRQCSIQRIVPQVTMPFFIKKNEDDAWKRRIYTCMLLNQQPCPDALMSDFEARGWKMKSHKLKLENRIQSTMISTDTTTLTKLAEAKPVVFQQIYYEFEGSTYLNAIMGSEGIGGNIFEQYATRAAYANSFGCKYNSLKIQMPQYRYDTYSECERMEKMMSKEPKAKWMLISPEGTKVESTSTLGNNFCASHAKHRNPAASQSLASMIVDSPFKLENKLFDVRSYILIGSTMPMMVFFQRGYVRRASGSVLNSFDQFDSKSEDVSLDTLQEYLATSKITGSHYVDTFLQSSMKQIAMFVFHAARPKLHRRKGSFELFSLDFVIDSSFHVYLEKASSNPPLHTKEMAMSEMIADMHDLVQELHEVPVAFETMVKGDKYGTWELIFSELRESCDRIVYNPCHKFIDFNQKDLVKSNKKVGQVQATQKRLDNEKKRIVKKTEEKKKNECREQKIPYPSSKCDKHMDELAQEKFNRLFKEHEASHNPNEFRLPKPGEVFAHESV